MGTPDEVQQLEARIAAASQAAGQARAVAAQVAVAEEQLAAEDAHIAELVAQLGDEEHGIEQLEAFTWTRVLASARGARDDSLARERAQRDAVALQLTHASERRTSLRREGERLGARRTYLTSAAADRASALEELDRFQASAGDQSAGARVAAADELGRVRARRTEVDEAVLAARVALSRLDRVDDRLNSAHGWSTYDTWFGGAAAATAVKYQRLDEAAKASAGVGLALRALKREMADIDIRDLHTVDGMLILSADQRFYDLWLDNIFTDFSVGKRIKAAQKASGETRTKVGAVVSMLEARSKGLAEREAELERLRDAR
jgi:hypothetical protein